MTYIVITVTEAKTDAAALHERESERECGSSHLLCNNGNNHCGWETLKVMLNAVAAEGQSMIRKSK